MLRKNKVLKGLFITSIAMMCFFTACGKKEAESSNVTIANPWVETDRQGVIDATGFDLPTQEGATDIVYSYMSEGKMAQVSYTIGENEWTYRVQPTDSLEDISGMYYTWIIDEAGSVNENDSQLLVYSDATEDDEYIDDVFAVHVVNWYDESEGATHSLSVSGKDVNGIDIEVIAENMSE